MNNVYITGNVGKDAFAKTTGNGFTYLNFSLGVSDSYKDKDGSWQTKTNWINCKALGKLAEKHANILQKGTPIFVYGKLETGSYEKDNRKIYFTNVVAETIGLFHKPEPVIQQDSVDNTGF